MSTILILLADAVELVDRDPKDWTHASTLLLIETYGEFMLKFADARLKKKDVWEDIASCLQKQGYTFSGAECSKKWSNLELR